MIRVHWFFIVALLTASTSLAYQKGCRDGITAVFAAAAEPTSEGATLSPPPSRKAI